MDEFVKMNTVCLKNMQMLSEVISNTMNKLKTILEIEYDNMEDYIKEKLAPQFVIDGYWERGSMFSFGYESDYEQKHLSELQPLQEIIFVIPLEESSKRKTKRSFSIEFGYISDTKQNVIYFHLFDESESPIILDSFITKIKHSIPSGWNCNTVEGTDIYVEFSIDNDFTIDKIKQCSEIFKEYILQPTISKLC